MFISMIFWLIGAALFTSVIGGSGLHCGHVNYSHRICNIVNSTMAFAWITWFVQIHSRVYQIADVLVGPSSSSRSFSPSGSSSSGIVLDRGRTLTRSKRERPTRPLHPTLPLQPTRLPASPNLSKQLVSSIRLEVFDVVCKKSPFW